MPQNYQLACLIYDPKSLWSGDRSDYLLLSLVPAGWEDEKGCRKRMY